MLRNVFGKKKTAHPPIKGDEQSISVGISDNKNNSWVVVSLINKTILLAICSSQWWLGCYMSKAAPCLDFNAHLNHKILTPDKPIIYSLRAEC